MRDALFHKANIYHKSLESDSPYKFLMSYYLFRVNMHSLFFLIKGEVMKDGGHSDGKSKQCGALRRGLLALFLGVGMTLGNTSLTLLIVSVGRSHLGLLGWCQIRVVCIQPLAPVM